MHLVGERSAAPDQAVAAAEELSFPVVVKTAAAAELTRASREASPSTSQRPGRCAKRPSGSAVR